ncbi:putative bifunctional diguanylate cyclase/phosphodiesterase [Aquabacterium sp.]|uniref:putative bifunctional diguanylate cyclase/phosphodiesterase n=1 Tax=Aquabacterium sp. TaxID=1872578 RepID=UPI00378340FB
MTPSASATLPPDEPDFVEVLEDGAAEPAADAGARWKVLIVDDDEDVHQATELALRGVHIEGRALEFLHAHSAMQARALVAAHPDIAVALLDVVMESPDAGLQLVRHLREELNRRALRVVLRTGQPGYAPEIETIRSYDINDYKTKAELTRVRLYTSLTAAIRSYRQILALEQTRNGLEIIVSASTQLGRQRGLQRFAEGLVTQLAAILGVPPEGLVCAHEPMDPYDGARIIAAAGRYRELIHRPLGDLAPGPVRQALERCLRQRGNLIEGASLCLYFAAASGRGMAAYVDAGRPLESLDEHLLSVFCASMSVAFENVLLYGQLVDYAYQDQLLRMPNRNRFIELITEQLQQPAGMALALVDIDDFAAINDTLGHRVGDQVLQAAAQRLLQSLGSQVVIARIGGDTFGLLGPESAVNPAVIERAFGEVVEVQDERMRISATMGLVRLRPDSPPGAELIKDAHLALKQAKAHRRGGSCYFSERMGVDARERMRLLRSLRGAFDERRLYVAYQPMIDLTDGRVIGVEALIRWRLDDGSFVAPDRFIPLAERSGLIVAIGEFVLRTACHELRRLHEHGHPGLRMSVNVSKSQFTDPDFLPSVSRALADAQVDARFVELEITESVAAEDLEFILSVLSELRAIGVGLAIDDFGTGYSSLSVLRQLGAQRLKIDRAFIHEIELTEAPGAEPGHGSIARMVVDLGRALGMEIIAEGVETEAQQQVLRALGCHIAQGYLYARPMPADELHRWLTRP